MKNIFLSEPTPGQQKVKEIVGRILSTTDFDSRKSNQLDIYSKLYKALGEDTTITADTVTGAKISAYNVSSTYLNWIVRWSSAKVDACSFVVDYTRMISTGSVNGAWLKDYERRIYCGGSERPKTTARALLTLGTGNHVGTEEMDISHYPKSKITIIHLGNHRALAYKLYGVRSLPMESTVIYDDSVHDEQRNEALLYLEKKLDTEHLKFKDSMSVKRLAYFLDSNDEVRAALWEHFKTRENPSAEDLLLAGGSVQRIHSIYLVLFYRCIWQRHNKDKERSVKWDLFFRR